MMKAAAARRRAAPLTTSSRGAAPVGVGAEAPDEVDDASAKVTFVQFCSSMHKPLKAVAKRMSAAAVHHDS